MGTRHGGEGAKRDRMESRAEGPDPGDDTGDGQKGHGKRDAAARVTNPLRLESAPAGRLAGEHEREDPDQRHRPKERYRDDHRYRQGAAEPQRLPHDPSLPPEGPDCNTARPAA